MCRADNGDLPRQSSWVAKFVVEVAENNCGGGTRRVGKQIVNVPSFLVRVDSQKHIDFALNSPFGGGRPGRNKRKAQKCAWPLGLH